MKKITTIAFAICLSVSIFSQSILRVAYLGDSYCNGCCVPGNGVDKPESYRPLTTEFLKLYYDSVETKKLCQGGETIATAMPDWHPLGLESRNIDSALRWGADLYVLQYSGNHFYSGYRMDSVKYYYKYIGDTLTALGKNFIFVSNLQRKNTLGAGYTYLTFLDSVRTINAYIDSLYPYQYVNVFDTLFDPLTNKPVWDFLGSDSLHWNVPGYAAFYGALIRNSPIIDSAIGFDKLRMYNTVIEQVGDSVEINSGFSKAKRIIIGYSDDGITFTQHSDSFYFTDRITRILFHPYIRLQLIRDEKIVTYTRFLN